MILDTNNLSEADKKALRSIAATELGKRGGKARTEAKQAASRKNGKLGGRPKTKKDAETK